jgi:hypothetical protein
LGDVFQPEFSDKKALPVFHANNSAYPVRDTVGRVPDHP